MIAKPENVFDKFEYFFCRLVAIYVLKEVDQFPHHQNRN